MKTFQIIFISAFALLNVVYSQQCDYQGEMKVKQCYAGLMKDFNIQPASTTYENRVYDTMENMDIANICQKYNKKTQCLGTNYEKSCLNSGTFMKVFGMFTYDSIQVLRLDFTFQYACKNLNQITGKISEKDKQCFKSVDLKEACYTKTNSCDDIAFEKNKANALCMKNALIQKCGNKNWAQFRYESDIYANQKLKETCLL